MDKSSPNMLFEDEGMNYYSKHVDTQVDKTLTKYIDEAFNSMTCTLEPQKPFVFMDYGTADAGIAIKVLPDIIEKARQKYGSHREFSAILNDVVDNDYKSVWKNVSGLKEKQGIDGVFFSTVAKSFYTQCAPSNSVHLGFTSMATHWMEKSGLTIKDSCFGNSTKDPETKAKIRKISEKEWDDFLVNRSKELVPGGVLILVNFGSDPNVPTVWEKYSHKPFDQAWNLLYETGMITEEEKVAALVPIYIKNTEEHKRPFLDPKSAVSEAGLELVLHEEIWTSYKYKELYEGKITRDNSQDIENILVDARASMLKVTKFCHLQNALDTKRSEEERETIMQQMFEHLKEVLKADTELLKFEDLLHFHVMVVSKRRNGMPSAYED